MSATGIVATLLIVCGVFIKPAPGACHPSLPNCSQDYLSKFCYNFSFLSLTFNNFFYLGGINIVMVHIVSYLVRSDIMGPESAPWMVSIIGISNLLGRVGLGLLCHFPKIKSGTTYLVCNIVSGIAIAAVPWFTDVPCKKFLLQNL